MKNRSLVVALFVLCRVVGGLGEAWAGSLTANTTVTLSAAPSSTVTVGTAVTVTATVTASDNTTPGTGTVTFSEGGVPLGSPAVVSGVATYTFTPSVGPHTLSAVYNTSNQYYSSPTAMVTLVANPVVTTTSLMVSPTSTAFGTSVTFTATVAAADSTIPTGTVTFRDAGAPIGTGAIDPTTGIATYSTSTLAASATPHSITAAYGGDATTYGASTSAASPVTVDKGTTSTALSSSAPSSSTVGQSVTFTATLTQVTGTGTLTGNVDFKEGTTVLGSIPVSGTSAAYTTSTLAAGPHSIVAVYQGDASFSGSTSPILTQQVYMAGTSVAVSVAPASPSDYKASLTITATVTSTLAGTPTGTVTLTEGPTTIATAMLVNGSASFTSSTLAPGPHTLTVTYGGDATFAGAAGSAAQVVNKAPSTTVLTSSQSPTVFGQQVTFTATVSSTVGGMLTGTVTFSSDGTTLGGAVTVAGGIATLATKQLGVGSHSITAVYTGDAIYATGSASALSQVVKKAATATSVISSNTPSLVGSTVTFTAVVKATSPGAGMPTGTVAFSIGGMLAGSGTLVSGTATFSTATLPAGSHIVVAIYSSDASFAGSGSAPLAQAVSTDAAVIVLTASPSPSNYGTPVTLSAQLAGSNGRPTGAVIFADGPTTLGTGTVNASGFATLDISTFTAGIHILSASYSGDTSYSSGVASAALNIGVATTTVALASSQNPSTSGESVTFTATVASAVGGFTGSVQFRDGVTSLAIVNLSGASATFTSSALLLGDHVVTATYLGNTNFGASTSTGITQHVGEAVVVPADMSTKPTSFDDGGIFPTVSGGGCGCDLGGHAPLQGGAAILLLVGALYLARRRAMPR